MAQALPSPAVQSTVRSSTVAKDEAVEASTAATTEATVPSAAGLASARNDVCKRVHRLEAAALYGQAQGKMHRTTHQPLARQSKRPLAGRTMDQNEANQALRSRQIHREV